MRLGLSRFRACRAPQRQGFSLSSVLVLAVVFYSGCSATAQEPKTVVSSRSGFAQAAEGLGDARCEADNRSDRVPVVSQALGADTGSIRRVYATGVSDEEGQRVVRCREVDTNLDGIKDLVRTYTDDGEPLVERADSNYDGKVDTWVTFARGRVAHMEIDVNGDGKPDEFRIYSQGELTKVQRDTTLDGKLDTWEVYDKGRLNRIGVDLNGDEKVDRWYRDSELERREQAEAEAEAERAEAEQSAGSDEDEAELESE